MNNAKKIQDEKVNVMIKVIKVFSSNDPPSFLQLLVGQIISNNNFSVKCHDWFHQGFL